MKTKNPSHTTSVSSVIRSLMERNLVEEESLDENQLANIRYNKLLNRFHKNREREHNREIHRRDKQAKLAKKPMKTIRTHNKTPGSDHFENDWSGDNVRVLKNPTETQFTKFFKRTNNGVRVLWHNNNWHVWDAEHANHTRVANNLGLDHRDMPHVSNTHERKAGSMYGFNLSRSRPDSFNVYDRSNHTEDSSGHHIHVVSDYFKHGDLAWFRKRLKKDHNFINMTKHWNVVGVHHKGNVVGTPAAIRRKQPKSKGMMTRDQLRTKIQRDIDMNLAEETTRKQFHPHLENFIDFACGKLGIQSKPSLKYKAPDDQGEQPSFAAYSPMSKEITIMTKNRHPMDIFRSVAHELVHHKQNEDGRLGKDIAREGATGSDIENEANSDAGKVMRWFAKANPDMFKQSFVTEGLDHTVMVGSDEWKSLRKKDRKSLFGAGGGFKTKGTSSYKNSTKSSTNKKDPLYEGVNDRGIFKAVFLAGGAGSGKDFVLKKCIEGNGLQELNSDKAFEMIMKKENFPMVMTAGPHPERDLLRGRAKNVTQSRKQLQMGSRLGVIINGTADDFNKIARLKMEYEKKGYDTMMVFVSTSNKVSRIRNVERGQNGGRTVPEDIRFQKWRGANVNKDKFKQLFAGNFVEVDNSANLRNADPQTKAKYDQIHLEAFRKVRAFVSRPVSNPISKIWIDMEKRRRGINEMDELFEKVLVGGAGNWGTPQLTDRYKRDTPGETPGVTREMGYHDPKENSKIGTHPYMAVGNQVKVFGNLPIKGDRVGATVGSAKNPSFVGDTTSDGNPAMSPEPFSKWSPIDRWAVNEETKKRFKARYGALAERKIQETVTKLKTESLTDPYDGSMGVTPNSSNIQDNGKPSLDAEFEKLSLFGKKRTKTKYKK